ncbi:MAG: hypothetical protein BroJett030_25000 [Alphaproteobacteria bacterium]|nr:MAG: hypothetical protein BroJett030_25000 [Alphaproteobacteria bacterium]
MRGSIAITGLAAANAATVTRAPAATRRRAAAKTGKTPTKTTKA